MDAAFLARITHPASDTAARKAPASETTIDRQSPTGGLLGRSGGILVSMVLTVVLAGCGSAQQTRSQTLQDYQAEATLLERLEAKHDALGREYEGNLREVATLVDQISDEHMRQQAAEKYNRLKMRYAEELLADEKTNVEPQRLRVQRASADLTSSTPPPR